MPCCGWRPMRITSWTLDYDGQASMHLYALTPNTGAFMPLARLLGAAAVLVADDSGDDPFDEACSRAGPELRRRFPGHPLPPGCQAATVEPVVAPVGGVIAYLRMHGDRVEAGEIVAETVDAATGF